ncbi:Tkl protein kinase, partial [Globisporangium splendens]
MAQIQIFRTAMDLRKHKLPDEENALAIETILEDGFIDATSPKAITTKVASVQQILTTTGFSDGLLPWHFACGGCSQVTSTICLDDDMRARFQTNGAIRTAILKYFTQKHGVDLRGKANKNMAALHFALKTNTSGCNADVVDVLLDPANCREQINDVHDHSTIGTLPPIAEGSQVDVLTANLHAIHCYVSSRSFDSKYHVILQNGNHLEDLHREQIQPSDRNSSVPAACGAKTKYLLLMESAFSPLHYALQSSDDMALRLLSFNDLSLNPDGSDLPLLALACVARRSAQVVSKLITQQVNMRVHLPLLGAQHDMIVNQIANCNLASRKNATALHYAVLYEDVDVVNVLVENKEYTNVNVRRSGDWFTPLHLACEMSHMELIKLLLDHGANLLQMSTRSSSANGVTPLHLLLKNDTPGNEKLKSLVAAKYLRRGMLLEDLGAPLPTHRSSPGTARDESMEREPSYTDLDVDGTSIDVDGDGIALSTKSKEQGIACMLLAIEEHNELETLIRKVWTEKRKRGQRNPHASIPLEDSLIAEWGYNVLLALSSFIWDAEIEMFLLCLTDAISDQVYVDQEHMITSCQQLLGKLSESYGNESFTTERRVLFKDALVALRKFYPLKTSVQLQAIEKAITRDMRKMKRGGNDSILYIDAILPLLVSYPKGFFVKTIRTQHFKEIQDFYALVIKYETNFDAA